MKTAEFVRYNNRKIYSKTMSRYVTVMEIKEFIDAGFNINVLAHETDLNVTRKIVGEIIKQCEGDLTNVYLFMLKRGL